MKTKYGQSASPQPNDPHLVLAHSILEQLMVSDLTKRQVNICLLVLRYSWGCGKKSATIPLQKDFEVCGVGQGHIRVELEVLERDNVIKKKGNEYSFNKNFKDWKITRFKTYREEKLNNLLTINLNGQFEEAPVASELTGIYKTYEENIGKLNKASKERLEEAIKIYTEDWVKDAIKEACLANKPTWVYIKGILNNWSTYGRKA